MRRIPREPRWLVAACLFALGVNAVMIQTVMTEESVTKQIVRAGVLVLALLGLASRDTRVPPWLMFGILWSAVLLVGRLNFDQLSVLFVSVLALLASKVSERSLLKSATLASWAALALVFLLLYAGVTQDEVLDVRQRHTYGTAGVPFFFNVVFGALALTVLYAVKYGRRSHKLLAVGGAVVLGSYLFKQTDARGGYVALLLFLALLWVVPRVRVAPLYAAVPLLMLALSVLVAYTASWNVNVFLSHRPRLYRRFLDNTQWTDYLFSSSAQEVGYAVDNSYLHLLVGLGLVTALAFLTLFARAVNALTLERRYYDVAFLLAGAAYCVSESLLVRIENAFIVYLWVLVVRYGGGLSGVRQEREAVDVASALACVRVGREASLRRFLAVAGK